MSIPLDRLYHFLSDVVDRDDIQIYRFFPHGSKKPHQCPGLRLYSDLEKIKYIPIVYHDQEPLSFAETPPAIPLWFKKDSLVLRKDPEVPISSYKICNEIDHNIYYGQVFVHSEKNSNDIKMFEDQGYYCAYWWSHAVIAQDWYRYAKHDPKLNYDFSKFKKDFLVYNRAWAGTREYRLKFAELIVNNNLQSVCQMRFSRKEGIFDYADHRFKNKNFEINIALENYFEQNNSSSNSSADYSSDDYNNCAIEIVLETLFDDSRWHLTEKTLRPIACNKPFILVGPAGILQYLREYGFKTFGNYIDESYDQIKDPIQRLAAVVDLMKYLSSMAAEEKQNLYGELNKVTRYNQQRFFSKEFFNDVVNEYKQNITLAIDKIENNYTDAYYKQWRLHYQSKGTCPVDSKDLEEIDQKFGISG